MAILLGMVSLRDRRGYSHLLDEFWADAEEQGVRLGSSRPVSAAAFCKARRRLKPELLRRLLLRVGEKTNAQRQLLLPIVLPH
jgi:hypothetical protein